MLSNITSMALHGLDGSVVSVQVDVSAGLPSFEIVGLPDVSVRESKERVKTAIKNSRVEFFSRKVIVNLAPVNTKKEGSIFDLPIAIGIMISMEAINFEKAEKKLDKTVVVGELSLRRKSLQNKWYFTDLHRGCKIGNEEDYIAKGKCKRSSNSKEHRHIASRKPNTSNKFLKL